MNEQFTAAQVREMIGLLRENPASSLVFAYSPTLKAMLDAYAAVLDAAPDAPRQEEPSSFPRMNLLVAAGNGKGGQRGLGYTEGWNAAMELAETQLREVALASPLTADAIIFSSLGAACTCPLCDVDRLLTALRETQQENWCDACAGTGKPVSGRKCMCRGTGRMSEAARYLREELLKAETERDALREELTAAKFRPLGDNHHNAAACPHCNPEYHAKKAELAARDTPPTWQPAHRAPCGATMMLMYAATCWRGAVNYGFRDMNGVFMIHDRTTDSGWCPISDYNGTVTHWMPLPAPPVESQETPPAERTGEA